MQDVAKQHRVERLIRQGKSPAAVAQIFDLCVSSLGYIESDHFRAEQRRQVMRDKTIAAAHVQHARPAWQHARHFQRHVVSLDHLLAAALSAPASLYALEEGHHVRQQSDPERGKQSAAWLCGANSAGKRMNDDYGASF